MTAKTGNGPGLRPRLILFDLDGTLIDSVPDLAAAIGRALGELGYAPHSVEAVRAMVGEGQRVLCSRALLAAGAELGRLDDLLGRFRRHYSERLHEQTTCYPGVLETLRQLPAGIVKAVATNKPGAWARRLAAHLGLAAHFQYVLGEDDVGVRKPDPALLVHLCAQAGVPPAEALMVGDSRIDMEAAHAAGMAMAVCTYGYGDPETMRTVLGAEGGAGAPLGSIGRPYVLRRFADLLAVVPPEGEPGRGAVPAAGGA